MWIFLYDSFLSIVHKDCASDELLVRARRKGDIEKIFPKATVTRYTKSDYLYRAVVKRSAVADAMTAEIETIKYDNFKSAVADKPYHDALLTTWAAMAELQNPAPYSGNRISTVRGGKKGIADLFDAPAKKKGKKR